MGLQPQSRRIHSHPACQQKLIQATVSLPQRWYRQARRPRHTRRPPWSRLAMCAGRNLGCLLSSGRHNSLEFLGMITYMSIGSIQESTSSPKSVATAFRGSRTGPIANGMYGKHIRSTPTNSTTARSASASVRGKLLPVETCATVISKQCIIPIHRRRQSKPEKDRDQKKPEKSDPKARQASMGCPRCSGYARLVQVCFSYWSFNRTTKSTNHRLLCLKRDDPFIWNYCQTLHWCVRTYRGQSATQRNHSVARRGWLSVAWKPPLLAISTTVFNRGA